MHHTMLGNGIPLIEHLANLNQLPDQSARLTALPAPVQGIGSFRSALWPCCLNARSRRSWPEQVDGSSRNGE